MKDILKWVAYGAVFAVPFVLLIVSSSMFFPYITGKNFAFRILVEVGFGAWILLALYEPALRPRLSYILYAVLALVGVMFFADLFGQYPFKSFWSNYERMEGWVTLLHFAMYFVMLGSLLNTEKLWSRFFNAALIAGLIMSYFALAQAAGYLPISKGGDWRVDARLGNSSYLGVYMLFHMFIAAWLWLRAKTPLWRSGYGLLIILFGYLLAHTGTRGTMYGLIGGGLLMFFYLALMAPRRAVIKKAAIGGVLGLVLLAAGVWMARDTAFVKESPILNRFAGTTLAEGNIRFMVWGMAAEGAKEHPLLGWGQENFNYVFNKYYDPGLYGAEPWYDRTHDIFMDWLITGGVIGLIAYLSMLAAALWYAVVIPAYERFKGRADAAFTVYEQALILGLLAAYMFHNLFVFDNLASWIFYAVVLALVHSRVAQEWPRLQGWTIRRDTLEKVVVPVVAIVTIAAVYFVNIPSMLAAQDIIDAYQASTMAGKLEQMKRAADRGGFGDQEIFEQQAQLGMQMLASGQLSDAEKTELVNAVETSAAKMNAKKPGDARIHIIMASFYRSVGDLNQAMAELQAAEKLSPTKQAILSEEGLIYLLAGRQEQAMERYQKAYDLDQRDQNARVQLAATALYFDDTEAVDHWLPAAELQAKGPLWQAVVTEPMFFQVVYQKKAYDWLELILKGRVELEPGNKDARTNLAALYYEMGNTETSVAILQQAIKDIPAFKDEGEALIAKLQTKD